MKKVALTLAICLGLGAASFTPASAQDAHPKLKKWAKIAGIGALTGGIGGVVLGSGAVAGATTGAATHSGFHAISDWWHRHKSRNQEYSGTL